MTNFFDDCLSNNFGTDSKRILVRSKLLQYLGKKILSVGSSPKSRPNLGNLYAIYVLVEDYRNNNYHKTGNYSNYSGANFSSLFTRQRQLPHGSKLQNHALNHRCNQEFVKFFPDSEEPIKRNTSTQKYWINENLLKITIGSKTVNISETILDIIDKYVQKRTEKYGNILEKCEELKNSQNKDDTMKFFMSLISPTSDARAFEVVSYVILKNYFEEKFVIIGNRSKTSPKTLFLFKTGRTNANDGGIDFVLRPLGRFFQVTEDLDFKKFFLDIDKINRFPITFVIKINEPAKTLLNKIRKKASKEYDPKTLNKYMECIEEIIPIPELVKRLQAVVKQGKIKNILNDFEVYFKVEFDIK